MQPKSRSLMLFIALLFVIGAASYFVFQQLSPVDKNKRQIVFLTNGQVYFGYLSHSESQFVRLRDVYYTDTQSTDDTNRKLILKRLSNASYGSENDIYINRDQILNFGNLKPDSRINQAINQYQEKSQNGTNGTTISPSPTN